MPAVSPSSQLKTELDSISTTVATGDDYARFNDLLHALNAYRQAGIAFGKLPPTQGSAALVAQVAAITSATSVNLAKAKALLGQLFALYETTPAVTQAAPTSSSAGPTLLLLAAAAVLGITLAVRRKKR